MGNTTQDILVVTHQTILMDKQQIILLYLLINIHNRLMMIDLGMLQLDMVSTMHDLYIYFLFVFRVV